MKKFFAKTLLPSSCAASAAGPKIRRPAARNASTTPATSGASGPTTVRSAPTESAAARYASGVPLPAEMHVATPAMPGFPGAAKTLSTAGLWARRHASACSRPPLPMINIFISIQ